MFTVFVILISLCPTLLMGYTTVSGDVSGQTWGAQTYFVTNNIYVNDDATLTVASGAVVKFAEGTYLTVNGRLDVNGSSSTPVWFTSMQENALGDDIPGSNGFPEPGDWSGIQMNGYQNNDGIGEFDYCRVRYGGDSPLYANVRYYQSDSGHFTNCESQYSAAYGLLVESCSIEISSSSFSHNADYAARLHVVPIQSYPNNVATSNGVNAFGINGVVSENMTWTETTSSVILSLTGGVTINDDITCTIPAGTIIKADDDGQFSVHGTLDVNGSETDPVVFTSLQDDSYGGDTNSDGSTTTPAAGDWGGISLYGYQSADGIGEFDYSRVRYGGNSSGYADANLYFCYSDSGHFTNSSCEYSLQHGLRVASCTVDISNSIFSHNAEYAAHLSGVTILAYPNNSATDNGVNALGLSGTVSENMTWAETSSSAITTLVGLVTVNEDVTCTIPAGTIIKSNGDGQFSVHGTLDVNGSETDPVVFTSLQDDSYGGDTNNDGSTTTPAAGDWGGISLYGYQSADGIGEFDYSRVRYGGNSSGYADANLYFCYSDSGHFTNSSCEYSLQHGLRVASCTVDISNSIFSHNAEYAAHLSGVTILAYPNNSATDNGVNALGLSGTVSENMTWAETSSSAITTLVGLVTVNEDVTCTIPAGTIIKSNGDGQFSVHGTLDVNGSETDPVVFTSLQDDSYGGDTNNDGSTTTPAAGDWGGISLYGYGDDVGVGEFDYCRVRYGGNSSGYADANLCFCYSDSGYFTNSVCEYSLQEGIRISEALPVFRGSSFVENSGYGVYISGDSNPDFGTNTREPGMNIFAGNDGGNYQFCNNSSNVINAYHNSWEQSDAASIDAHIYDDDEDHARGEVLFNPWLGAPPATPQNVVISIESEQVCISWEAVVMATSYTVYSDSDPYGAFTVIEWSGPETNWCETFGFDKFYRVTAQNE